MNTGIQSLIVNAIDSPRGETRVAQLKDQKLDRYIELNENTMITKGNIYDAVISSDVPSLEAYFVDYGEEKHGFLPYKETKIDPSTNEHKKYKSNDKILVQISKEERGTKGAALSGELTIPGVFLVLLPFSSKVRGISKNISETDRQALEKKLESLEIPENMGIIARTAAKDRDIIELKNDLNYLVCLWQEISNASNNEKKPQLIFSEGHGIHKIIRDAIKPELDKIIIDHEPTLEIAKKYISELYPQLLEKITFHSSNVPIFTHYQIEDKIESMFLREIPLQSGGRLVIDRTEALYSIDVNSAQATKADNVEKTAFQTNLEAVREIAQIIRIREIHGIIAIDLIDMQEEANKTAVVKELCKHVACDKSRVHVADNISDLGILELSRQRTRPSLSETHLVSCPRCSGRGLVRTPTSFSYSLIHIIEQHAIHGKSSILIVQTPLEVGTYLLNEKHETLREIERRQGVLIKLIPNPSLEIPQYSINRVRNEDFSKSSLNPTPKDNKDLSEMIIKSNNRSSKKAVITNKHSVPKANKKSIVQRIFEMFSSEDQKKSKPSPNKRPKNSHNSNRNRNRNNNRKTTNRRGPNNNRRGPKAAKTSEGSTS